MMLMKYDIHSVILDAFDAELLDIARGNRQELVLLVQRAMMGDQIDNNSLSPEEIKYVKTVKVLLGEVLYSHSWLEN